MKHKELGKKLKTLLKQNGHTTQSLASHLGVANTTVWRWCAGTRGIPVEQVKNICTFLGVTPNDIFTP